MAAEPEALETVAYTRFVLDCGAAGDILDLYAALAPCVLGYAEIGPALAARPVPGNPYAAWIATYAGPDYQAAAGTTRDTLARLWVERGGDARGGVAGDVQHGGPARDCVLEHGMARGRAGGFRLTVDNWPHRTIAPKKPSDTVREIWIVAPSGTPLALLGSRQGAKSGPHTR